MWRRTRAPRSKISAGDPNLNHHSEDSPGTARQLIAVPPATGPQPTATQTSQGSIHTAPDVIPESLKHFMAY